jgi:ATP-dependent Lhr-like helicase
MKPARFPFPALTEIQRLALPLTTAGKNALLLAPTGHGKTLAAFYSVLEGLRRDAGTGTLGNAVKAVYVSPLKALTRDIHRNLERLLDPGAGIRVEVRTGDTDLKERARQQRKRPHLLLTTPESLASLLSQQGWADAFDVEAVIVDEIHALAENKRGTLAALCLERLEHRSPRPLQRIGLSATAWPVEAAKRFLCGSRECAVAQVDLARAIRLEVAEPGDDIQLLLGGWGPDRIAPLAADLISKARCTLAFTSTRSAAERLALLLRESMPDLAARIEVHHGSIGKDARERIESDLAGGQLRAVVCSSSLELGVDFQAVDQVLLIGTPRGVSRAVQRLGRSGHRVDGVASGSVAPLSLPDLLECAAVVEAARAGRLDQMRVPAKPLDVLAQTLLGMAVEREWGVEEAFEVVRRAGPYLELGRDEFGEVLEYLEGKGRVLSNYPAYGKVVVEDGRFRVSSKKTARDYYVNIGCISDAYQIRVLSRGNRKLGEVEEGFLASLRQGEAFVIAGKAVKVKTLEGDTAIVEPAEAEGAKTPRWMGGKMPLSAQLAEEEVRLRRALRIAWDRGGADGVRLAMEREWRLPPGVASRIAAYVERQTKAAPVPVDCPVQVERLLLRGRTRLLLFHNVAGRAVNRSLAWVAAQRFALEQERRPSVVAHYDDHAFLLSVDARLAPDPVDMAAWFRPEGFEADLLQALRGTETLGRKFRAVAETGVLLPKRAKEGRTGARNATWSASLLYRTLMHYEPEHPLLREALRQSLEDELDAFRALESARRIYQSDWEVFDLPRPSPFALPLFATFQREVLMTQSPDDALEDVAERLYRDWEENQ